MWWSMHLCLACGRVLIEPFGWCTHACMGCPGQAADLRPHGSTRRLPCCAQVVPASPEMRHVSVQVLMEPKRRPGAAAQAGSPQLAEQGTPPRAAAAAAAPLPAAEAAAAAGNFAAAGGGGSGARPPAADATFVGSKFGPRAEPPAARPVRRVQERTEDGMALVHLPPGVRPTAVAADRQGSAAAQQRYAEAVSREAEQRRQREAAAEVQRRQAEADAQRQESAAQLQQQEKEGAAGQKRQKTEEQLDKQNGKQAKVSGKVAGRKLPAQPLPAAPRATGAPPAAKPAPAAAQAAVAGHKRARSLSSEPAAQPANQCSPVMLAAQQKIRAVQVARQQQRQRQQQVPAPGHPAAVTPVAGAGQQPQQQAKRQRVVPAAAPPQQHAGPQQQAPITSAQRRAPLMRLSPPYGLPLPVPAAPDSSLAAWQQQQHSPGGWRPTAGPLVAHGWRATPAPAAHAAGPAYQPAPQTAPRHVAGYQQQALQATPAAAELTPQQIALLPTRPNLRPSSIPNPFLRR